MPALPQPPEIDYSYTGFATGLGDGSFPGTQIDNDFANVVTAATEVTDFLASTFRSDGKIKAAAMATTEIDALLAGSVSVTTLVIASGTVTPRTLAERFAQSISSRDCGAIGDGGPHPLSERFSSLAEAQEVYSFATSLAQQIDWAAIVLSLNLAAAGATAAYLDAGTHIVGEFVEVPSRVTWFGPGIVKAADGITTAVVRVYNRSRVTIAIEEVDGNKANCPAGGDGIAVIGDAPSDVDVVGVNAHDCKGNGISFQGDTLCERVMALRCRAMNNGLGGITVESVIRHGRFLGNHVEGNATHGLGIHGAASFVAIVGNNGENNGPGSDNFVGYSAYNSDLTISNNTSRGGLNHGIHFGGSRVAYVGNVCTGTVVGNGIRHSNHLSTYDNDVTMVGNVCEGGLALPGIWMERVKGGTISGNVAANNAHKGIFVNLAQDIGVTGNVARGNALAGIHCDLLDGGVISGNISFDNEQRGIVTDTCTDVAVTGNECRNNLLDGIRNLVSGARMLFANNICRGNGASGIRIDGVTGAKVMGNVLTGNTVRGFVAGVGSTLVELVENDLSGNTAGALDVSTSMSQFARVEKNRGYNPVGLSSITVGASPFTYTAGVSSEVVHITGGTVSAIKRDSTSVSSGSNRSILLQPGQALTVTYSALPTMVADVQ